MTKLKICILLFQALGNNDIDKLSNEASPFLQNLQTTILASNVLLRASANKIQKSIILDVEGIKVGLVSYLTPDMGFMDSTGEIEYINEVIALQDEVKKLQEQNVNIIVALGHADHEKDMQIAYEVEGLDLIIAGHRNVYYWNGTNASVQQVDKAVVVTRQSGRRVPIVQSYSYDKYLGQIDLKFNTDGEVSSYDVNPILLDASIVQDAEALQMLTSHSAHLAPRSQEIVGQTAVVLDGESCGVEECNLGNLVADAINYYYAINYNGEEWTDAPLTIIAAGAIAASISPTNRPASITMSDLMNAIPTESNLVAVTMPGPVLLEVLEHAISTYDVNGTNEQFLQFSGVRVVYDISKAPGLRVVSAVVRCWACLVPEFFTIDERSYKVLMPAALANGDYGYSMLSELTTRTDIEYDEVTCTAEYIRLRSPVYPEVAGRIQFGSSATILKSTIIVLLVALTYFIV